MRNRNRSRSLARRGFTLIEILLVLVIIAVIAGIVVVNVGGTQESAFKKIAAGQVQQLRQALLRYQVTVGGLPSDMSALWTQPSEIVDGSAWTATLDQPLGADPWGREYIYRANGSQFEVRCMGPDGQPDTEDDIVK